MDNVVKWPTEAKTPPIPQGKVEWLIFQLSFTGGEDGQWHSVFPEDLPEWVKTPRVVRQMREGIMVCGDPDKGRLWFRVLLASRPDGVQ